MKKKEKRIGCLVLCLCFWVVVGFANLSFARAEEHIFNKTEMYRLLHEGYDWNDIIAASMLTYKYQIPLETVLKLQPENCDWTVFEASIKGMSEAGQMARGKAAASPEIRKLQQAGFTEKEIAYIAFQSQQKRGNPKDSVDQWVTRKNQNSAKSELAVAGTLSLTVEDEYTTDATGTIEDPGYEYNIAKCTPYRVVLENGSESISPSSGALQVRETDLSLPGRNGLDFHLTRVYDSAEAKLKKVSLGVVNTTKTVTDTYGIGNGWKWDVPYLEEVGNFIIRAFMGGGNVQAFSRVSGTASYTSRMKDYTFGSASSPYKYVVKHNSGVNYYFDSNEKINLIKNRYGDTIQFTWDGDRLTKVVDSVKRVITFTYTPELVTVTLVSNSNPYQVKYYKRQITSVSSTGQYELYQVELPEQTRIQYSYKVEKDVEFDFSWLAFAGKLAYLNLESKTNPYGGKSCYEYGEYRRSSTAGTFEEYFKVVKRSDQAGGKEQNATSFTYQNHGVKDQSYYTTIFYYGTSANPNWSRKEHLTFNKDHLNTQTVTELAEQPGYKETKATAYYRQLPEYVTVTKSNSSQPNQSVTFKEDYEYDEYGNVIHYRDLDGNRIGHYQESTFSQITKGEFNIQVLDLTRERVKKDNEWSFVQTGNGYDEYGNVTSTVSRESTGNWHTVTETVKTGVLDKRNSASCIYLPVGSSRIEIGQSSTDNAGIRLKCWEEGKERPEDDTYEPIIFDNPYVKILDPAKEYILEVSLGTDEGSQKSPTVNISVKATYCKLVHTAGAVKASTHSHYASPATFGLADQVHLEYGSGGGAAHDSAFGTDSCMITRYEYNAAVDNPVSTETYANLFPSKVIQYVRGVDHPEGQAAHQEITEARYNRFGNITQLKKYGIQNGTTSEILTNDYTYDGLNRLTSEIYRSNKVSGKYLKKSYFYSATPDANGLYETILGIQDQASNGFGQHVTCFYYDKLGQYVKTTQGSISPITVEKVTYDAFGRKESVEDGVGVKTVFLYDGLGREIKVSSKDKTGVEKAYKETVYNDVAREITENFYDITGTKTLKGKMVKGFNAYGQIIQTDQYPVAAGSTYYRTKYTYDLQNQVTSMTDPRSMTLTYEYDYFGVKKVDYPGTLRGDDVYVYNYLDRTKEVKKTISSGYIVTEYDELDRVRKMTYPEGRVTRYYYDGVGRLVRTTDSSSTQNSEIVYEYDLTGNVKNARHTYDGNVFNVGYEYDEKGNLKKISYPGEYQVNYEYDQFGRVIKVPQFVEGVPVTNPDPGNGGGTNPKPWDPIIDDPTPDPGIFSVTLSSTTTTPAGIKYKANGFMEEIRYTNGVTTIFTDDSLGRIRTISNPVLNLTYGYDGKGNVTSITGTNGVAVSSTYTYYDNDWLKDARQGQNTYAYSYDAAGNCVSKTINGVQTSYTYDLHSLNLLRDVNNNPITHDVRGNMIRRDDTGYIYTYYESNELKQVTKTNGSQMGIYSYNSEGKRYKKVENGKSTYYVYNGESLLYELKPDGTKVYYIYLNGKQIAKVEGGRKYFYHTDHLGSTRAITDDQGNVAGRFEYQPFGAEGSTTGDDTLTYTGKMQDDPTGLMYFNARYYDPTLGRFVTEDAAKDGINWYIYCENKPLRYKDPSGNVPVDTVIDFICIGCDLWRLCNGDLSALIDLGIDGVSALCPYYSDGARRGVKALAGKIDDVIDGSKAANKAGTKIAGSNIKHLNGAVGEAQGWKFAMSEGHIGIQAPGKVTQRGPDFITFNPEAKRIIAWDAKYSSAGRWPLSAKGFGSNQWLIEIQKAINSVPDEALRKQLQKAFEAGDIDWNIFQWPKF